MDHWGTLALVLTHSMLGLLLLSALFRTELSRPLKAVLTILLGSFFLVIFESVPGVRGWPGGEPPQRFKLIAYHVEELDKAEGGDGAIFLWANDIADGPVQFTPRAYRVEFTSAMNISISKAGEKMRQGHVQIGEVRALSSVLGKKQGDRMAIDFFSAPDESFSVQ